MLSGRGYASGKLGACGSVEGKIPFDMEGTFKLDYAKCNLVDGESLTSESLVAVFRLTKKLEGGSSFIVEFQEGRNPCSTVISGSSSG